MTTLLIRLTRYEALDKAAALRPHALAFLPFATRPYLALYFLASLIIVSYVLGAPAPTAIKGMQWIRDRKHRSKASTDLAESQVSQLNPVEADAKQIAVRRVARVSCYSAVVAALAVFVLCVIVSLHADSSLASFGRSKLPPITTVGVLASAFSKVWHRAGDVMASAILATAIGLAAYAFTHFLLRVTSPREQME